MKDVLTDKYSLLFGNCLERMKEIPDGSVDLILTDPPYGTTQCKWDTVIPFDLMWEQLKRIIKPNGAIVLFGSEPFSSALRMSNIKQYKYDWVWEKDKPANFALANKQPMKYHENVMVFCYGSTPYFKIMSENHKPMNGQASYGRTFNGSVPSLNIKDVNKGGSTLRNPSSIQKFNTVKHNSMDKGGFHPTQKPVALLEYLIKTYAQEGETVLDFTMGSGSTIVAAINTNRKAIGIEMDEGYFDTAVNRVEEASNKELL